MAIEFRGKRSGEIRRQAWGISLFSGNLLPSILLGVTLGNFAWGVPLSIDGELAGTFLGLLNPYTLLMCLATLLYVPRMVNALRKHHILFVVALANMMAIANISRENHHGHDGRAFLSSCAAMTSLMALYGLNIFPSLVYSLPVPEYSLAAYNATSSTATLGLCSPSRLSASRLCWLIPSASTGFSGAR